MSSADASTGIPLFLLSALSILLYIQKENGKVISNFTPKKEEQSAPPLSMSPVMSPVRIRKALPHPEEIGTPYIHSHSADQGKSFMFLTPISSSAHLVEPLVKKISSKSRADNAIVIGIAGGSGSGKTTLARAVYETIGIENIAFLSHDSYYKDLSHLPFSQREKQNFDHPDSLDTALLVQHVKALKSKEGVFVPNYDYSTHSRTKDVTYLPAQPVILVEGILIFTDPALYELIDIRIFVDTDDDIRFIRRVQRDTCERGRSLQGVIDQYINTVRPMHLQYVEPSKRNADIIVPVGLNSVALDLVVSKLKSHLSVSSL